MIVSGHLLRCAAIFDRELQDGAIGKLPGLLAIELFPGRVALWDRPGRLAFAARDLGVVDKRIAAALVKVGPDHVAGPQPREPSTGRALGRCVQDRRTVRCAGLTTVAERR